MASNAEHVNHRFHRMLVSSMLFEEDWRKRAQKAWEYYDGMQWTQDEAEKVNQRGQQASVLNVIRPTVDMVMSVEMDRRTDFQVVPREPSDEPMANVLTELVKQIADLNDHEYYLGKTFRDGVICGRGWQQVYTEEPESKNDLPQVRVEYIPWEECYPDPYYRKPDASDARYIIRQVWMDRDEVKAKWPGKAEELDSVFNDEYKGVEYYAQMRAPNRGMNSDGKKSISYYDRQTERVLLNETWYKDGKGKMRYCIWSDCVFLEGGLDDASNKLPYQFNELPLVAFHSFRNHRGEPMGLVDYLMDMQDMLNKENSKYLWNISTNRLLAEDNAVEDIDALREEWNRPDGVVKLNPGGLARIRENNNLQESGYLMTHMEFLLGMVQRTSGINDSMLGLGSTNERSAQQLRGRVLQGSAMQTSIMENLFFTKKQVQRLVLLNIGQFYTERVVVRTLMPTGAAKFYELNKPAQGDDGKLIKENEIGDVMRFDVSLKHVPPYSTVRQNTLTAFTEVAKTGVIPPQVVAEIMVELSDLPNKQAIMAKIQQFNQMQAQQMQQQAIPGTGLPPGGMPLAE
jgi:hypothetical protein